MRRISTSVLIALVAGALLAGCSHSAGLSVSPSPGTTTYTSRTAHFLLAYDPSRLRQGHDSGIATLAVNFVPRGARLTTLSGEQQGVSVFVSPRSELPYKPTLAGLTGYYRHYASRAWTVTPSHSTLSGLPASQVTMRWHRGAVTIVTRVVWTKDRTYAVEVAADAATWRAFGPALMEPVRSFRITN